MKREKFAIMSKRKSSESIEISNKKSKFSNESAKTSKLEKDYQYLIDLLTDKEENFTDSQENQVLNVLEYFKSIFPKELFEDLPPIIHLHQLYSLIKNKTQVDRDVDSLRSENRIILFKFDSNQESETLICFSEDYNEYIKNQPVLNSKNKNLVELFLTKILINETSQLSISKSSLLIDYRVTDSDISALVQVGLLSIKDPSNFYFSIPGLGKFRRILLESRKSLLDQLRRQKYKEINLRMFFNSLLIQKNKSFRNINRMGAIYVICDLIGSEEVRKIDSPMGIVIKLN